MAAHRAAYVLWVGEISKGKLVCHKCDNKRCVNPDHLYLGTHVDNMKDRAFRNRTAKGERCGAAKLTAAKVIEIRQALKNGMQQRVVAEAYGVGPTTICYINTGKAWAHVGATP